ncbi:apolipoprotein N-acyltransferase [Catellatospora sp. TT07R-123]|uniref:nitrilase-related carbon-nitrogen hydrolase n=1 Tax=Catellatospora sp. TT07R-123 TaxID=2733863 RepID=UPI001B2BDCE5|nr:nitrilase-related carbon-nitrogen hydrolase [Catellatospora sp. TT07R-123]GHJ48937.1 apolipoprotein N-acyltransferase [Catellatospora sp. TT07R-123]
MASKRDRAALAAAALASGAALYFGTGLRPLAWLTWIAVIPVLLAAPRLGRLGAALAAAAAWLIGTLNEWTYLTGDLGMPPVRAALIDLAAAGVFAAVVLAYRALIRRGRWAAAVLLPPAAWVGVEYLFAISSPDGAFWSLAYTQTAVLPVAQLASLTSYLGITFVLLVVQTTVAVTVHRRAGSPGWWRPVAAVAVGLAAVSGYGLVQLGRPADGPVERIALIAQPGRGDFVDIATPAGTELFDGYLAQVRAAVGQGAKTVVLPEAVLVADPDRVAGVTDALAAIARDGGATIVFGVAVRHGYNTAQVVTPDSVVAYHKQHLLFVEPNVPGTGLTFVPDRPWGVAICKDLDFPDLARSYRAEGAELLLVPAWDMDRDGWLHSRMAVMRGIENGLPIVRSGRMGALTVSDAAGRVLAEARTGESGFATVTYDLPVSVRSTLYTAARPWFAWLCLLAAAAALLRLRGRPRSSGDHAAAETVAAQPADELASAR